MTPPPFLFLKQKSKQNKTKTGSIILPWQFFAFSSKHKYWSTETIALFWVVSTSPGGANWVVRAAVRVRALLRTLQIIVAKCSDADTLQTKHRDRQHHYAQLKRFTKVSWAPNLWFLWFKNHKS